jgi:hypothetical protein
VQPITDAFGAGMNGGLFRSADVGDGFLPIPVDAYLGINLSGALTATTNRRFVPPQQIRLESAQPPSGIPGSNIQGFLEFRGPDTDVPTAFGETEPPNASYELVFRDGGPDGPVVTDPQTGDELRQTVANAPQGLLDSRVPVTPLPIPQFQIGTLYGTDLQLRYFPPAQVGGYGELDLFGVGLRHDIDQWIPVPLPLEIAVQGAYNQFGLSTQDPTAAVGEFQEVVSARGWAANLQVSRGIPAVPIQAYSGLQVESFNAEYSYTFNVSDLTNNQVSPQEITLDQDAATSVRGILGLTVTAAVVRFNVDYAVAANDVLTVGLGVRL